MNGAWKETYSGKKFTYFPVNPDAICIEDIGHSLANQCRFTGHTRVFYSVAEHSYHVSHLVPPQKALKGLLHDGSEAYTGDLNRPLKHGTRLGLEYRLIEAPIQEAIQSVFGLDSRNPSDDPDIHNADNVMLLNERAQLMAGISWDGDTSAETYKDVKMEEVKLYCWTPEEAEFFFLKRFHTLTQNRFAAGSGGQ